MNIEAVTPLQLTDYQVDKVLYRLGERVVYRAYHLKDGHAVAIETFDTEYPDRQQVAEMRHEGRIAQQLRNVDGVRNVADILTHGSGNLALITELFEQPLRSVLHQQEGVALSVHDVLDIALQLTQILGDVHVHGIVHKAISPEHILYDANTKVIALAGFGMASELDQERQAIQLSRSIEGPLPYLSPEQTGRMNRDLDYRSDYYSLGIVLYELLTGSRPYEVNNPLEWVHSHISRLPPIPHEVSTDIPIAVSDIVLKLLAKSPDERYQSTKGLLHDLRHCIDKLSAQGSIEAFVLGERDVVQKFLVPQNLYGREHELDTLLSLFEAAVLGETAFCLVHGYSGVGKSALVNEIDRPLVRERGFLVQGKFQQYQQGDAYTAIASAFRGLVQQVLAQSEDQLVLWRQRLMEALVPNAGLVVDLVPELELIIGHQPSVSSLPPVEARNRLHIVLTAFLRVFSGEGHPVVLFLDDLQWCDAPTLGLLQRLVTSHDMTHLLLIGSYRSNEVGAGHPLRLMLESVSSKKVIHQLPLKPLNAESVEEMVAEALCREPEDTMLLSDMLYEKAQGNPFFTNELLRQLYTQQAIYPDSDTGQWEWDLDAAFWAEVSHDVVAFMVENLRQLPAETQRVLQLAACIGGTFDLETLATIYERPTDVTAQTLLPALKQHAVLPLHSHYRLIGEGSEQCDFNPSYRFQHDRVQQAAYALIDEAHLSQVHLNVGQLMLRHVGQQIPDERLIDIVEHLNEGRSLILVESERLTLAQLNLRAGIRAKQASAYESALSYLKIAAELLPTDSWKNSAALMYDIASETQYCAYLTGRTDEADVLIDEMLLHTDTEQQRSDLLARRTRQYATLGRMDESIQSAIQGLALLGIVFTEQPTAEDIEQERHLVQVSLGSRHIADLIDAPLVDEASILTAMRLLMEIFPAAFLSGSGNLFPYLVLKAVNLSLRYGNCPESAFAYAAYGMLLCGEFDEPAIGYEYAKVGLAINENHDDLALRARVIYVYAMFVHHWSNHWSSLTPWFHKGIEAGYQSGDLLYLAYSAQDCVIWDPSLDLETAHRLHAENLEIVRDCAYQDSLDSGTLFLQLQRNLLGLTEDPFTLSDETFDESQCIAGMQQRQFMTGMANYHIYKAEICLLYGDYDQALEHVRAQDKLIKSAMSLPQLVRFYIVAFLTLSHHYPTMDDREKTMTKERLEQDLDRMSRWADNCEANFHHLQLLMEAELDRLEHNTENTIDRYDAAIDVARKSGFLRDEAMACECAARYLLSQGRRRSAEGYLRGAYHLYNRWGAHRKVVMLDQEFPVLRELVNDAQGSKARREVGNLDLASVMKASRTISSEIVLERLLKTTIHILLENAGGQWGCLVVRHEGNVLVESAVLPEGGLVTDDLPTQSLVQDTHGGHIALPMTLISQVLHNCEAVVLNDAVQDEQFGQDPYIKQRKPVSILCIPIQRERFEGAIYMENNLTDGVFTEERVETIRLLAAQASVAIENARLYEQVQDYSKTLEQKVAERTEQLEELNQELKELADYDGLTGVANRRRGDTYLDEVWPRLQRERKPLSIIMLDVDHFKSFNDNYGHQVGDECLIKVAAAMLVQLQRPADLVARYGGEEFILILPDTDRVGAGKVGERLRESIERLAIEHAHSSTASVVTVSVGIATTIPNSAITSDQLLSEADKALYQAKRMGRNQVQLALANFND